MRRPPGCQEPLWRDIPECRVEPVLVVVPERLGNDGLCLLIVGKVVRPDVLPLEGVVERFDVAILLRGVYPDVFHLDS